VGIDPSPAMLARAQERGLAASVSRASAEALPFDEDCFDRVVAINAVHHFASIPRFCAEARRVLRASGRVMSICLDPSAGSDSWFLYDYFPRTRELDLARFPKTSALREQLAVAGFVDCETLVAERIEVDYSAREVLDKNMLTPSGTSQLAIISEAELQAGIARIRAALAAAEARGEDLRLRAKLALYATFGTVA
jgi:SAM-dependent methyltransferase